MGNKEIIQALVSVGLYHEREASRLLDNLQKCALDMMFQTKVLADIEDRLVKLEKQAGKRAVIKARKLLWPSLQPEKGE